MKYTNKIILVGFNKNEVRKHFQDYKINDETILGDGTVDSNIVGYQNSITQLYNNNGVFFDYVLGFIDKGLKGQNCIENDGRIESPLILDAYPLFIKSLDALLNKVGRNIIFIKRDSEYSYLCNYLNVEKYEYDSLGDVIEFIDNNVDKYFLIKNKYDNK